MVVNEENCFSYTTPILIMYNIEGLRPGQTNTNLGIGIGPPVVCVTV